MSWSPALVAGRWSLVAGRGQGQGRLVSGFVGRSGTTSTADSADLGGSRRMRRIGRGSGRRILRKNSKETAAAATTTTTQQQQRIDRGEAGGEPRTYPLDPPGSAESAALLCRRSRTDGARVVKRWSPRNARASHLRLCRAATLRGRGQRIRRMERMRPIVREADRVAQQGKEAWTTVSSPPQCSDPCGLRVRCDPASG